MKRILIALLLLASTAGFTQSQLLLSDDVLVDATYTTKVDGTQTIPVTDLLLAGMVIHASAANASVIVYDGTTGASGVIYRYKVAADETSGGVVFTQGGIAYSTNLIVDLTNCTATLYRRRK